MTILHISPSYYPAAAYGGPTVSVARLCEALAAAGHRVQVYCTNANGAEALETPVHSTIKNVQVRYFKRITGDHSHLSPTLLWAFWRHCWKYDAVHIHSWWNLVAMPAVLICRLRGVRPVLSTRGMLSAYTFRSPGKRWFHRRVGRHLLRQCLLHCTSAIETRQVREAAPACQIYQSPNILTFKDILETKPADRPIMNLCFIGRLHPVKGLLPLFQALASVSFPWRLTIAGVGEAAYTAQLRARALELGIHAHMRWIGWVDGAAKYRLLAASDLFVLTSYSENFANAALEALAMGTPVLLGAEVGLADYARHSGAGSVCAPEPEAIAAALEDLHRQIQTGAFDRTAIARQTRADFDPERIVLQYLDAYRTLAQRKFGIFGRGQK